MSLILAGIIPAVFGLTHLRSCLFFLAVFVSGYCITNVHVHPRLAALFTCFIMSLRKVRLDDLISVFRWDLFR